MNAWTTRDIPRLADKTAVVTGGNSGLGFETARALALKGARVVIACRNPDKGNEAVAKIKSVAPDADVMLAALDLASLASIKRFAAELGERQPRLDILCNNAGVMALPYRETADGFEMQIGTNHLGHFALTALLMPLLDKARAARVVSVSSNMHRVGRMRFDDLMGKRSYSKWGAYGQSKLANLLFTYELQHRLDEAKKDILSVAAHPGYAATNLQAAGPQMEGSRLASAVMDWANRLAAQDAAGGALPTLYAAVSPSVNGGEYFGPAGFMQMNGPPKRVSSSRASHDRAAQQRLWDLSQELTGVGFPI
jgi:NAD(P)-dependent dehydrogenase (short-subunit alcohol dehydrogenase family)